VGGGLFWGIRFGPKRGRQGRWCPALQNKQSWGSLQNLLIPIGITAHP